MRADPRCILSAFVLSMCAGCARLRTCGFLLMLACRTPLRIAYFRIFPKVGATNLPLGPPPPGDGPLGGLRSCAPESAGISSAPVRSRSTGSATASGETARTLVLNATSLRVLNHHLAQSVAFRPCRCPLGFVRCRQPLLVAVSRLRAGSESQASNAAASGEVCSLCRSMRRLLHLFGPGPRKFLGSRAEFGLNVVTPAASLGGGRRSQGGGHGMPGCRRRCPLAGAGVPVRGARRFEHMSRSRLWRRRAGALHGRAVVPPDLVRLLDGAG